MSPKKLLELLTLYSTGMLIVEILLIKSCSVFNFTLTGAR